MTTPTLFFTWLLWRLPTVLEATGLSRAAYYAQQADGLWTHPILIGPRTVAWPAGEIAALTAARIASHSDDEIRVLVKNLEAARKSPPQLVAKMHATAIESEPAREPCDDAEASIQDANTMEPPAPDDNESMADVVAASLYAQRRA